MAGVAAAVFPPALAALTWASTGARLLRRIGRNEAFNHGGNAMAAGLAAGLAILFGPVVVFWIMAALAGLTIVSTLVIPAGSIETSRRGLDEQDAGEQEQPPGCACCWPTAGLLVLCGAGGDVPPGERGDAALGGAIADRGGRQEQRHDADLGVHRRRAMRDGADRDRGRRRADRWGRKPMFLFAFAVWPDAACSTRLSNNPYWLLVVQLLDGIGAGITGRCSRSWSRT